MKDKQKNSSFVLEYIQIILNKICAKLNVGKKLTTRSEDYSKWYNELVVRADLAENSAVRGCMVIKPMVMPFGKKCNRN